MHSPRQGPNAGTCEHGSKPPGFVKSAGFLVKLSDRTGVQEYVPPWSYLFIYAASNV